MRLVTRGVFSSSTFEARLMLDTYSKAAANASDFEAGFLASDGAKS